MIRNAIDTLLIHRYTREYAKHYTNGAINSFFIISTNFPRLDPSNKKSQNGINGDN